MKSFFKIFFASLLALVIFTVLGLLILFYIIGNAASPSTPVIGSKGVLVLDLGADYKEQTKTNPFGSLLQDDDDDAPGLYDVVRILHYAKLDSSIKGLYIKAGMNSNSFASSEELRQAIADFKQSKKFVVAYGDAFSQKDYYVATEADKIYCNPSGSLDWDGFSVKLYFLKGLLDKLGIQPEVFYAGKFKSATEPFRVTQMTDANRLQTTVWLNDLYSGFLLATSEARKIDTAQLHLWANQGTIQTANDALTHNLVDGLKYDDEIRAELARLANTAKGDEVNLVPMGKYAKVADFVQGGNDKIALIFADGEIVDSKPSDDQFSGDELVKLIRKARLDADIKAIVFRVNSPGGSSLASDKIWREVSLAKKDKPVVISMGNYAASGGYYISCNADSIYADAGTITGSIGVFTMMVNMQQFYKDKLGVTFDGVKTAPYADMGESDRPLSPQEQKFAQAGVDTIYARFKQTVANGRNKDVSYIDSIAQGHVWTGKRAIGLGLVDKIGSLQDAVECAARMAKTNDYMIKEFPDNKLSLHDFIQHALSGSVSEASIKEKVGSEQYNLLIQAEKLKQVFNKPQTRLPFEYDIR